MLHFLMKLSHFVMTLIAPCFQLCIDDRGHVELMISVISVNENNDDYYNYDNDEHKIFRYYR